MLWMSMKQVTKLLVFETKSKDSPYFTNKEQNLEAIKDVCANFPLISVSLHKKHS